MSNRGIKVVLIEDDEDDIYLFKQSLQADQKIDREIVVHRSFHSLVSDEQTGFDVCVLDLGLPDSEGLKTVIKVLNYVGDIPVIVLTGLNDNETGEQAIQLGAQDYIPKADLGQGVISRSIRFSIERNSLLLKMKNMANVDPLTLLYNRTYFMERLDQQISLSDSNHDSFAVMMIDLDGFKEVNDTLGHQAGDQVLTQFAARMRVKTRHADVLARYGGDEFVTIINNVTKDNGWSYAAEHRLECCESPFWISTKNGVQQVSIGMSIGMAIFPDHADTAKALLEAADEAMYEVKAKGKNGYLIYSK